MRLLLLTLLLLTFVAGTANAQQTPLISTDTFNGSNGDALPTYSSNWVVAGSNSQNNLKIEGTPGVGSFGANYYDGGITWTNDHYAQAVVDATNLVDMSFGQWWLMLRVTVPSNNLDAYVCGANPGVSGNNLYRIGRMDQSAYKELALSQTSMQLGDTVNCQIVGTVIILSITPSGGSNIPILLKHDTAVDYARYTTGKPGIKLNNGTTNVALAHNFIAGSAVGGPTVVPSTYTAATCSSADVNAVVNGPTHWAVDGDVIQIPKGSCAWSSGAEGVLTATGLGITFVGGGGSLTPNSTPSTFLPSSGTSGCSGTNGTTITLSGGAFGFIISPEYGNAETRISCMSLTLGASSALGGAIGGLCTASGCPNLRIDNLTLVGWDQHSPHAGGGYAASYGVFTIGNVFGVADHNYETSPGGGFTIFMQVNHPSFLNPEFQASSSGAFGDNSWATSEGYGSANSFFFENNTLTNVTTTDNENPTRSGAGGTRIVVRFNIFNQIDSYNTMASWHENRARARSGRVAEIYGNTLNCTGGCSSVAGLRGGTTTLWGNLLNVDVSTGSLSDLLTFTAFRRLWNPGGTSSFGACDGSTLIDTNDGMTYYGPVIIPMGGVATDTPASGYTTVTVPGSPGWSANQWATYGSPYSIHDVTQTTAVGNNVGAELVSNGTNTLVFETSGGFGWTPVVGDSITILRTTSCADQGGRGAGTLVDVTQSNPTLIAQTSQVVSPAYLFSNLLTQKITVTNYGPVFSFPSVAANSYSLDVIQNRDFYTEPLNTMANVDTNVQSNATTPFDGTGSPGASFAGIVGIGVGHGTLARRPTTCTVGVGYLATDQGSWNNSGSTYAGGYSQGKFYTCVTTNNWAELFTPYNYPHPLIGNSQSFSSQPTNTVTGVAFSPSITITVSPAAADSITLSVTSGTCTFTGTATQTSDSMTGVATFSLTAGAVGTSCVLTAHNNTDGTIADVMSSSFNITSSCVPDHLTFTSQPSNALVGGSLGTVSVAIKDAGGVTCTSNTSTVTLSSHAGSTAASPTSSSSLSKAAVAGVATWTDLSVTPTAGSISLDANDGMLTLGTSNVITISAVGGNRSGLIFVRH